MLTVNDISFAYSDATTIKNNSFTLRKGKSLALLGESGCGKSTLLKLIYGLFDLDNGEIFWNDTKVLGPKYNLIPGMPFMKYLAQDFDLMPFITVAENVGKYLSNFFPEEKQKRIAELLEIVEMTEYAHVKAKFLSGGQMQRVALAKVLALEPEVLLLDEPFSHIDNFRKNSLRRKLFGYLKTQNITCIFATHDSTDALSFAQEVAIIKDGKIIDFGDPKKIYDNTKNNYTASLFDDVSALEINGIQKLVYPHQLEVATDFDFMVKVTNCYFKGSFYLIEANYQNQIVFFNHQTPLQSDENIGLKIKK